MEDGQRVHRGDAATPLPMQNDDPDLDEGTLDERTVALQAQVDAVLRGVCRRCGARLCGHEALLAVVFGCRNAPRCAVCLAGEQREELPALLQRALDWIRRRDCFLHVWRRAGEAEGFGAMERPSCLPFGSARDPAPSSAASPRAPAADAEYDAGDLGCGDLVLELRFRLLEMPPGAVLRVTARDPAAPIDLPAWCGLCGHTLLHAFPPDYWIQRKRD